MTSTSSKSTSIIKNSIYDKKNGDKPNHSNSRNNRPDPPKLRQKNLNVKLPTPAPTPKSPCFVHSDIDPSVSMPLVEMINRFDDDITQYSNLAETAVSVREISKKLGNSIQAVMVVTKPGDLRLVNITRKLAMYLITTPRFGKDHGVTVYVDKSLKESERLDYPGMLKESPFVKDYLKFWTKELCARRSEIFNFLGGDGTVLYTSWLFQKVVPPVLPFHMGSLGFLTNFSFKDYKKHITNALDEGIRVNLRMRFTCTVYRRINKPIKATRCSETGEIMMQHVVDGKSDCDWNTIESPHPHNGHECGHECEHDKDLPCLVTQPAETFQVLNDLVVDRGAGPYMSLLELFGDDQHLTTVQADGLVISTPTGSTAYSVSAGGSLVHPAISALLITPICPHTLSFRPMLLPDSMELRICVPYNSRSTAWASFDGRGRVELRQGDHIKVTPSKFPFPTVCLESQSKDWFNSISRCLRWNEREKQKSFVVVEEEADEYTDSEYDDGSTNSTKDDDDDGSTKADDTSEHEFLAIPGINAPSTNQLLNQQTPLHKRTASREHAFACIGKDVSDSSSNNSNSGEEEEWRVVTRRQKKKKYV
ncbi:17535_t:CDS:2, partial [Dentiscutata erythropus]